MDKTKLYFISAAGGLLGLIGLFTPWITETLMTIGNASGFQAMKSSFGAGTFGGC